MTESQTLPGEIAIAEMSDDTLADMWHEWQEESQRLSKLSWGAHQELEARMRERGATHLETENWRGRMKPGAKNHTIDDPTTLKVRLSALPEVSVDDLVSVFVFPPAPPMRVDQRGLNELHKRGGEIAEMIDEERKTVQSDPRLVLERKKS